MCTSHGFSASLPLPSYHCYCNVRFHILQGVQNWPFPFSLNLTTVSHEYIIDQPAKYLPNHIHPKMDA
ncbi:hypothetical protein RJT34_23215 [Clitoria ternatea]|uniref:Uncharacterized protein n=1 Tax=Clitoria ternatea TaxID=43366 RepID=A0AAN9FRN7_CLITE